MTKHTRWILVALIVLVLAAAAVVVGYFLSHRDGTPAATPSPTPTETAASPPPDETSSPVPTAPVTPPSTSIPAGFEDFYAQEINWEAGTGGLRTATINAPLSWREPGAGTIELALNLLPATGERQGAVLINPGGPGGSGITFLEQAQSMFGSDLRAAFDIVGFDPRGVGQSTPIRCLDDAAKDAALSEDFTDDEAGLEAAMAATAVWGAACLANSGELLGNVDTQSAARDMDLIRALLGEERLNFLGFSYGTLLGATYASLFPQYVGAMVLDGAIDVELTVDQSTAQQAEGFEMALTNYVRDCQASDGCPLTGSVDEGLAQIRGLLDAALANPIPTSGDRVVTQTLAFYGIAVTLYDEASWQFLTMALQEYFQLGTGDMLLFLADFYNDRNADGTFSTNSTEAFRAVNCLDGRGNPDMAVMRANLAEIEAAAPTMGSFFGFGGLSCYQWPFDAVTPIQWGPVATDLPIVVIGTTGDPATPYEGAHALVATLGNAVLVTFDGEGHTAYGRSNNCILDAVDAFFVSGTIPADGLTC